jgi:hypothetical protein
VISYFRAFVIDFAHDASPAEHPFDDEREVTCHRLVP